MNYPLRDDKNGTLMVGAIGNGALSNGVVINGNRPYETHPGLVRGHFHHRNHHHHHHHQLHPPFHETPSWHIKDEVLPQVSFESLKNLILQQSHHASATII